MRACATRPWSRSSSTRLPRATRTAPAAIRASLKAGFRYGDSAPRAVIELVDRDTSIKGKEDRERHEAALAEKAEA